MNKISPKIKLGCKKCESKNSLDNISFKDINISAPTAKSAKIVTLKGGKSKSKNKGLF